MHFSSITTVCSSEILDSIHLSPWQTDGYDIVILMPIWFRDKDRTERKLECLFNVVIRVQPLYASCMVMHNTLKTQYELPLVCSLCVFKLEKMCRVINRFWLKTKSRVL